MISSNVLFCGISSLHASFLKLVKSHHLIYNILGLWIEKCQVKDASSICDIKIIDGKFEDLLEYNDASVLFLCAAPYSQYQIFNKLNFTGNRPLHSHKTNLPVLIFIPPVSPTYNINNFKFIKNQIYFAMPMRHLYSIYCLYNHLHMCTFSNIFKTTVDFAILPSYWRLGELESVNIRLSTVNNSKNGEYSWICEPESMGGGLLNLYCAGLIDLIYFLTGGFYLSSVTCISRTFDSELTFNDSSIRRISSDDFVTIVGEIDTSLNPLESNIVKRKPVVNICISSELPHLNHNNAESESLINMHADSQFKLLIEVNGSAGSFKIDESSMKILWIPKCLGVSYEKSGYNHTVKSNAQLISKNGESHMTLSNQSNKDGNNLLRNINTGSIENNSADNQSQRNQNLTGSRDRNMVFDYVEKLDDLSEIAHLNLKNNHDIKKYTKDSSISPTMKYAWSRWLTVFSSTMSKSETLDSTHSLVASPDHWIYIQSVLTALTKSSKMKCWIDVSTGERM